MANLPFCSILQTNITVTDMDKTVDYLDSHLEELKGEYICVSNVHTTVMSSRDINYRCVQNGAAMILPDGKPLSIVQRKRGYKEAGRVPGPDLMPQIFALSEEKGYKHFFYGSTQETLDKLQENLTRLYPKLNIVGMYSPPFRPLSEEEDVSDITMINESGSDFIWVGLGAPKQENWMAAHKGKVCGVMLGVGAGFDFHAGTAKRAPKWVQELCLEWFYRLLQDPKRLLPRYVSTNAAFMHRVHLENKENKRHNRRIIRNTNTLVKYNAVNIEASGKSSSHRKAALKIAMIGHKRIPSREGGVEIVVKELSTRMVKLGHEVHAYNRRGSHVSGRQFVESIGKNYEGVRILSIPTFENGKLNAIVYSFFATIRAMFGGYDVIHFHAEGPCIMMGLPRLFGKRVIATIHGLDWQRAKWGNFASRMLKKGEKTAVKYADEIIVLSSNMKQYFMDTYGRETVFIPNGISKPEIVSDECIQDKWGLKKDEYILFLARIVPEKGAHYLIEAFKQIETNKKLVIAGGSSHSAEYYESLKKMAEGDERIVFTDFVGGVPLESLFSNAYLFVLPSDIEGMALGVLEAMSYGNACLVSDIPENTEVVHNYAEWFEHGNVAILKEKIEYLLSDIEKVNKYKKEAADYICNSFDWDTIVDRTLDVYCGKTV